MVSGKKNLRGEGFRAQNAGSSDGADLVPGLMARHFDGSPGPLPGLRFVGAQACGLAARRSERPSVGRERRARSEPVPLAEEGEARAALGPPALGDCRDKLSAPGAAQ
jgi:hypothetical protein